MTRDCKLCGSALSESAEAIDAAIANGICPSCLSRTSGVEVQAVLEAIPEPVLLMQGNPRQVVSANSAALRLFAKQASEIANHRGGQVFDCVHSFTAEGCGKDINCEHCVIKNAIVDTFAAATPHYAVSTTLPVKKAKGDGHRALQVSTKKIGDLALVRIERYEPV